MVMMGELQLNGSIETMRIRRPKIGEVWQFFTDKEVFQGDFKISRVYKIPSGGIFVALKCIRIPGNSVYEQGEIYHYRMSYFDKTHWSGWYFKPIDNA